MDLIIISGRSGSGKSTALRQLEDDGYFAIDNLPASLLPALVRDTAPNLPDEFRGVAVFVSNTPYKQGKNKGKDKDPIKSPPNSGDHQPHVQVSTSEK